MSLSPTIKNLSWKSLHMSAVDWARFAIGSDKILGEEGFENFKSGDWNHFWHYKYINNNKPEYSGKEALDEMSEYRIRLAEDIMRTAQELDDKIKRLAKMEKQIHEVLG